MLLFAAVVNGDFTGTERPMSTSGCLNTGMSPGFLGYEVGAKWTGQQIEEDAATNLDSVEWPDNFQVGDRVIDLESVLEVGDNEDYYSFKFAEDGNGEFGVFDMMAMCGFLGGQCTNLIPADGDSGAAPVCAWTLKQEDNAGEYSCIIGYQYTGAEDQFEVTDCTQVEDDDDANDYDSEEEEEGGDDEGGDENRRRAANNFENCDATYYRGASVGSSFTSSCGSVVSDCGSLTAVTLDLASTPAVQTLPVGTELSASFTNGDGEFDSVMLFYSIEACDTCLMDDESDEGYDRGFMVSANTGASIVPTQAGYICAVGYDADNGLACDTRQVVSIMGCNTQLKLNVHFGEAVDAGTVLGVVEAIMSDSGETASAVIESENIEDLLPSLAAEEDADEADDADNADSGEGRRRMLKAGQAEITFLFSGASDVHELKSLFGLEAMNEKFADVGLPDAEWTYTEEMGGDEGLPADSILLNDFAVTMMALGFLVGMIVLFQLSRRCGGSEKKREEDKTKEPLTGDQQPNQYGV